MQKARAFKKWCAERQGHPPQIKAALEAIIELEKNMCIYARENIGEIDFDSDEDALTYFANFAENHDSKLY